jgi:hypothetical protein
LVPDKTQEEPKKNPGKGFQLNPKGFYLEQKRVIQRVLPWGQQNKPFRFHI